MKISSSSAMRQVLATLPLLIAGCGEDPVAQHLLQLSDPNVEVRRAAVKALDPYAGETITLALAGAINDTDFQVQRLAIQSLGERGKSAEGQLPALESTLADPNAQIRVSAALAIHSINPDNQMYVPVLVEALQNAQHEVFLEVGKMGSQGAWAVPTLIETLSHKNPRVRGLSALTLGQLGTEESDALAALAEAQEDPDRNVRNMAQRALELIQSP